MVDETLILRKLGELDQHLGQLAEFSNITLDAYRADWKTQRVVERTLQIMLELCVDIANHIIADESLRPPKNYADTFVSLEERGVLPSELSSTMQKMARFRNIIVHGYDKLDETIIIGILKRSLPDFADYRDAIIGFLKS